MKCFGDKRKAFHVKVVLLDEQELIQEVQESTTGQELLETVFQHLNLLETSYFGLRYIDPSHQTHWLDPNKRLAKQLRGTNPFTLYFSIKFYAADPTKLIEEITRYQFFLQIKQDILQGRLPISQDLASELGSLAVQSELGDYDPLRHCPGYVSEFRFIATQSEDLENKIAELHKKLVGQVPSKAELAYLEKVKWLDMYGVDLHPVLGEDSTEYFLGLTPSGIVVLRNKAKVGNYFWPRISKVYFRGRFFMLRVKDKNNSENTYGFETPSKSACKHLWQCCVEHHAFFRLTQSAGNCPQAIFSLGSKFRYSGRTEKEALMEAKRNARSHVEFARSPSRRYQRRILGANPETTKLEEPADPKPSETRTVVSLPTSVMTVTDVCRSTSMTLSPRSESSRSVRSAPYPASVTNGELPFRVQSPSGHPGRPLSRGESPTSLKSGIASERNTRRTSSIESYSSADSRSCSRSCSRHGRSCCRSSDGESETSSKCSSRGHRRHGHKRRHHHRRRRHHSDDSSDQHKHRHRRYRHRSREKDPPQLVESSAQWENVQAGQTLAKGHTATVRDLTAGYNVSAYDDTEPDSQNRQNYSRRKYRKHKSPSDSKLKGLPDEIRPHIDFKLQTPGDGLTEHQLKEIPYTRIDTNKNSKSSRSGSPKGKRHKSPKKCRRGNESSANTLDKGSTPEVPETGVPLKGNHPLREDIPSERTRHHLPTRPPEGIQMPFDQELQVSMDRALSLHRDQNEEEDEMSSGFMDSTTGSFIPHPTLKNDIEMSSQMTPVLKPQPSPQSSVTSGISIGSSSASTLNSSGESSEFHPNISAYPNDRNVRDVLGVPTYNIHYSKPQKTGKNVYFNELFASDRQIKKICTNVTSSPHWNSKTDVPHPTNPKNIKNSPAVIVNGYNKNIANVYPKSVPKHLTRDDKFKNTNVNFQSGYNENFSFRADPIMNNLNSVHSYPTVNNNTNSKNFKILLKQNGMSNVQNGIVKNILKDDPQINQRGKFKSTLNIRNSHGNTKNSPINDEVSTEL